MASRLLSTPGRTVKSARDSFMMTMTFTGCPSSSTAPSPGYSRDRLARCSGVYPSGFSTRIYLRQTEKFSTRPFSRVVHMEGAISRASTRPVPKKRAAYPAHRALMGTIRFQEMACFSSLGSRETSTRKANKMAKVITCLESGV